MMGDSNSDWIDCMDMDHDLLEVDIRLIFYVLGISSQKRRKFGLRTTSTTHPNIFCPSVIQTIVGTDFRSITFFSFLLR